MPLMLAWAAAVAVQLFFNTSTGNSRNSSVITYAGRDLYLSNGTKIAALDIAGQGANNGNR